jgi:hypothetical protein
MTFSPQRPGVAGQRIKLTRALEQVVPSEGLDGICYSVKSKLKCDANGEATAALAIDDAGWFLASLSGSPFPLDFAYACISSTTTALRTDHSAQS